LWPDCNFNITFSISQAQAFFKTKVTAHSNNLLRHDYDGIQQYAI
jgi:hypothetical protein